MEHRPVPYLCGLRQLETQLRAILNRSKPPGKRPAGRATAAGDLDSELVVWPRLKPGGSGPDASRLDVARDRQTGNIVRPPSVAAHGGELSCGRATITRKRSRSCRSRSRAQADRAHSAPLSTEPA